jgi:hypothetical protein
MNTPIHGGMLPAACTTLEKPEKIGDRHGQAG